MFHVKHCLEIYCSLMLYRIYEPSTLYLIEPKKEKNNHKKVDFTCWCALDSIKPYIWFLFNSRRFE